MTTAATVPPAYRLVARDAVESTNDEAKRLAEAGAEEGTLVWARMQRQGRGRHGRVWLSPPGNLYLSLVLRPDCAPRHAGELAFVAALGVAGAIGALMPPMSELAFKWPNDVLLNDRKVAGILLESALRGRERLDWLVLGLGLNVALVPEGLGEGATSLVAEGGGGVTVEDALAAFGRHFLSWVRRWVDDGFAPVRNAWLHHAKGIGETVTVTVADSTVEGRLVEIDETGALVLALAEGERCVITAGEVMLGSPS